MFSGQGTGLFATQMEFCRSAEINGPHPFHGKHREWDSLMRFPGWWCQLKLYTISWCVVEHRPISNSSSFSMLRFRLMASAGQGFWINQQILQVCWLDSLEGGHRWREVFWGLPKAARARQKWISHSYSWQAVLQHIAGAQSLGLCQIFSFQKLICYFQISMKYI